jgi:hypothetical protein
MSQRSTRLESILRESRLTVVGAMSLYSRLHVLVQTLGRLTGP